MLVYLDAIEQSNMNSMKWASSIFLIAVIFIGPSIFENMGSPTLFHAEAEPRPVHWPSEWDDTQIICFEFPEELWPNEEIIPLEYLLSTDGSIISENASIDPNVTRTCVGGLIGFPNAGEATREAAMLAGFDIESHVEFGDVFIDHINPGGSAGAEYNWEYWFEGKNAIVCCNQALMENNTWIIWRIVA